MPEDGNEPQIALNEAPPQSLEEQAPTGQSQIPSWIGPVFFLSGFAALIYQVVWQRSLFAIYGINVESVTIVVTAFMLGLGSGSIAGGFISRKSGRNLLLWFAGVELAIGIFGLFSLKLFHAVGAVTLHLPQWATGAFAFLLVLTPTMLMGATLPMLVAFLVGKTRNVGRSVSVLYCANTMGSALAALFAGLFLLGALGQSGAVFFAVGINLSVGGFAFYRRSLGISQS